MKAICASVNLDLFMVLPRPTARIAHAAKLEFSSKDRSENRKQVTKDITFPTDAKRLHAAIKGLTRLARKRGVRLRQSYVRIAKRAAMMAGRYAHAKQFNRDSPDESQTGINVRVFPALLQDRCEVLTATSTSGNPNAWSWV